MNVVCYVGISIIIKPMTGCGLSDIYCTCSNWSR